MSDKLAVEIENFRPQRSNTLYGFATVFIPELRLRIADCPVHEKTGKRWVNLPARPQVTKEGTVRRDDNGKTLYATVIEFTDSKVRDAFSERVITALLAGFPEAFEDDQPAA
jgi:hypothetical protein